LAVPAILLFIVLLALPQDRLRGVVVHGSRERFAVPTPTATVVSGAAFVLVMFALSRIMMPEPLIVASDAVAAAIIMASLVVLVGYAGEVSLATMALAGIGGTVFFHHVGHGPNDRAGLGAYAIAMVVTALVGAAIALPALRLRGLYLALATAAFSLAVEQLLFKEFSAQRRIYPGALLLLITLGVIVTVALGRSRGWRPAGMSFVVFAALVTLASTSSWLAHERWSALFPNGNLSVPRPRIFGIDFTPQANYLLLLSVVFVLVGFVLVALRRSAYGRRLNALKDSPAACATLGMNVVGLKLSVFMLSAAIAGLGGCLFAQEIGAVTGDRFNLFESMSMLMLLVVAGAGYVSGGLAGGVLYGSVFVTLHATFAKLGVDYAAFAGLFAWLSQFTTVLPALIGVSLGRSPSGFLGDAFDSWRPMFRSARAVLAGGAVVEVVVWFLAFRHVIGDWTFALVTIGLAVALPRIGPVLRPAASGVQSMTEDGWGDGPLELVGFGRPFTDEDRQHIDDALGLEEMSV
jgi:ABC-type branched-subunit amino acid transport system permease subunit